MTANATRAPARVKGPPSSSGRSAAGMSQGGACCGMRRRPIVDGAGPPHVAPEHPEPRLDAPD